MDVLAAQEVQCANVAIAAVKSGTVSLLRFVSCRRRLVSRYLQVSVFIKVGYCIPFFGSLLNREHRRANANFPSAQTAEADGIH